MEVKGSMFKRGEKVEKEGTLQKRGKGTPDMYGNSVIFLVYY